VWTLQTNLLAEIERNGLPYWLLNDYPLLPGSRRGLSSDLALFDEHGGCAVALELKYEPSHRARTFPGGNCRWWSGARRVWRRTSPAFGNSSPRVGAGRLRDPD
jgi:hypothetical protein